MESPPRRSSSVGVSGLRFPLPGDFFPAVACNDAQAAVLQSEADKIVRDTVRTERWEMHNEDSQRGWKLASSRKHFRDLGVRTYTRKPEGAPHGETKSRRLDFKCMAMISMPLEQAMDALYSDNTSDCRHNAGTLLEGCLDAAVLHVIHKKSDAQPRRYLGINWIALRNTGVFAKKRDMCYLRCTGTTLDENRDEVGYVVMRSIDLKECPPLEHGLGLVRTNLSAILLLKELPDGRSTSVIWQGTMPLSKSSPSKVLDFVHGNFLSIVANLNVVAVTRYLIPETDLERLTSSKRESKACHLCSKKFSLLRSRHRCHACGENMCRDCEVSRKTPALDRESLATHASFGEKEKVRRYCKRCMVTARRKAEDAHLKPLTYDFTQSSEHVLTTDSAATTPVAMMARQSERMSSVSSTGSQCSIQLTWPELSKPSETRKSSRGAYNSSTPSHQYASGRHSRAGSATTTPTYASTTPHRFSTNFSTSQVPMSPLTIKTQKSQSQFQPNASKRGANGRDRLETDPWEYYDEFGEPEAESEAGKPSIGTRGSMYSNNGGRDSVYSSEGRGSATFSRSSEGGGVDDLAMRLWEISRKAQETLDATRRNSWMMSDTASAPRSSEQFQQLDRSIAEQADLLNVIGLVSTGRVYMETGEDEYGDHSGGVRISETSIRDDERFEILT